MANGPLTRLQSRFQLLTDGDRPKAKTAVLPALLRDIAGLTSVGFSRIEIWTALRNTGYEGSYKHFVRKLSKLGLGRGYQPVQEPPVLAAQAPTEALSAAVSVLRNDDEMPTVASRIDRRNLAVKLAGQHQDEARAARREAAEQRLNMGFRAPEFIPPHRAAVDSTVLENKSRKEGTSPREGEKESERCREEQR